MALIDVINSLNPVAHYPLGDQPPPPAAFVNGATAQELVGGLNGTYLGGSCETGHPSLDLSGANDSSIRLTGTGGVQLDTSSTTLQNLCTGDFTVFALVKHAATGTYVQLIDSYDVDGSGYAIGYSVYVGSDGKWGATVGVSYADSSSVSQLGTTYALCMRYTAATRTVQLFRDAIELPYIGQYQHSSDQPPDLANPVTLGVSAGSTDVLVQHLAFFDSALTLQQMSDLSQAARDTSTTSGISALPMRLTSDVPTGISSLPMLLSSDITTGVSSLPLRLTSTKTTGVSVLRMRMVAYVSSGATTLPMRMESMDVADVTGTNAKWRPQVLLGGFDLSARVVSSIRLRQAENESGTASLSFLPTAGAIVPEAYENQRLVVRYVGLDAGGSDAYAITLYTGTVETASYSPDAGVMEIRGTTDLQGRLEATSRAALAATVGGLWSEHVFDDSADGYQYALDRLSTQDAEMHIDRYGQLQVVPTPAKASPDFTFTDGERFDDTLQLERALRRDLISQFRVTFDFRFVRLRQRDLSVKLADALGFCHYLDNNWQAPQRDMVRSAADGTAWTRIGDVSYIPLPATGTYCGGKNWVSNSYNDTLCLGASWKAARRWAQTVTEVYTLDVVAPDLVETVGTQYVSEDYGVEAVFDADDWEASTDFSTAVVGGTYDPALQDTIKDATSQVDTGRTALQAAIDCALAKGQAEMRERARRTRVRFSPQFRPDVGLEHTVRVVTPSLTAKGKVAAVEHTLDPGAGALDMSLELALSRHGGSGLPSGDPLTPPAAPPPPAEVPTPRSYTMTYHLGSITGAPPDNSDWDGYVTNVASNGVLYDPNEPVYSVRLVVAMPEIEASARDAVEAQQVQTYNITIPQDELTMSA